MIPRLCLMALALLLPLAARAETAQVTVAEQYGIAYLPLTVMRDQGLLEKRLKEAGLASPVRWSVFSGSSAMTDAVLSGGLDFASGAFANFIVVWSKTRGAVRAVVPLPAVPLYLLTTQPGVNAIADLGPGSHIAVPTVGVSTQAFLLQHEAVRLFGPKEYKRFDALTVAMAHPDAANMLLSGRTELNGHFSAPPFQALEMKAPAVRRIASSYEILGGKHTSSVVWASTRFHDQNPRAYEAFVRAYADAVRLIQSDPRLAAEIYLRQNKSKEDLDTVLASVTDPEFEYGLTPLRLEAIVQLLTETGRLAGTPEVRRDLFFPGLPAPP